MVRMAPKSRNAIATATVAFVTALSLYSVCAFAQSMVTQSERKLNPSVERRAASAIRSEPPNCSAQTRCIEDPATGKLYQFDASGKMTIIE
jgi:hypothetical protein